MLRLFPLSAHEQTFRRSPSRFSMVTGAVIGSLNGILLSAILFSLFPVYADLNFFLIALNSGLFTGLFVGGLIGLWAEYKGHSVLFFFRGLAIAQGVYLLFIALLLLLQSLAPESGA